MVGSDFRRWTKKSRAKKIKLHAQEKLSERNHGYLYHVMTFIAAFFLIAQAQPTKPAISLRISAKQNVIQAGSELQLTIVATNITDHDISLFRGKGEAEGEFNYKIDARDDKGIAPSRTWYGNRLQGKDVDEPKDSAQAKNAETQPAGNDAGPQTFQETLIVSSDVLLPIQPGGTLTDVIIVNEMFDLRQPGKYSIQAQRLDPGSRMVVKSNIITVTVTSATH